MACGADLSTVARTHSAPRLSIAVAGTEPRISRCTAETPDPRWATSIITFDENAESNIASGIFNVSSDEYEQFLVASMDPYGDAPDRLSPEQAAEYLWNQFIERAGIARA